MAGTFRERPEIGRRVRVLGSSSWKSATPWSIGVRPVTIVFQTRGEAMGWKLARSQVRPFATRAERFGRRPSFMSRSRSDQSAPSQPTRMTFGRSFPPAVFFAWAWTADAGTRKRTRATIAGRRRRR